MRKNLPSTLDFCTRNLRGTRCDLVEAFPAFCLAKPQAINPKGFRLWGLGSGSSVYGYQFWRYIYIYVVCVDNLSGYIHTYIYICIYYCIFRGKCTCIGGNVKIEWKIRRYLRTVPSWCLIFYFFCLLKTRTTKTS